MVERLRGIGNNGLNIRDFGGPGLSSLESGAQIYELAKVDATIASFFVVHNSIGMAPIDQLGSQEQRARMLPDAINFKAICCFALTEPDFGSDATSLKTTATKTEGGYLINGHKRWIGNADIAKYIVVWAKNLEEDGKI